MVVCCITLQHTLQHSATLCNTAKEGKWWRLSNPFCKIALNFQAAFFEGERFFCWIFVPRRRGWMLWMCDKVSNVTLISRRSVLFEWGMRFFWRNVGLFLCDVRLILRRIELFGWGLYSACCSVLSVWKKGGGVWLSAAAEFDIHTKYAWRTVCCDAESSVYKGSNTQE